MTDALGGIVVTGGSPPFAVGSRYPVANVAALRALSNATLAGPNYVDLASYYAAAGTAPDGGGGLMAYAASDTTTADNGMTVFVDAAGRRWYRVLNGKVLTALQCGWVNDGGSGTPTDNSAKMNATLALGRTILVPENTHFFASSNVTMGAGSALIGPGSFATSQITMSSACLLFIGGNSCTIDGITLEGGNVNGVVFSTGLNLQFCRIVNCFIFNFAGICVQLNVQLNSFLFHGNNLQGSSFGFLFNQAGLGGNDLVITGNVIDTGGDPIEINAPSTASLRDVVITGNNLTSSSASFGVGLAGARDFTISGNYINSNGNGVHIEDAQSGGVVSGNTIVCPLQGIGVWIEQNDIATGQAVTVTGNSITNTFTASATSCTQSGTTLTVGGTVSLPLFVVGMLIGGAGFDPVTTITALGTGTGGAGTYTVSISQTVSSGVPIIGGGIGIEDTNNVSGTVQDSNISENTISGFPIGAYLNGPTTYGFNNNLIQNCFTGIVCDGGNTPGAANTIFRVVGTTRMNNVTIGAQVPGGSQLGKFIWDTVPTTIVQKRGTAVPGITLEGVSLPIPAITISGSGAHTAIAFAIPGRLYGRLRSFVGNGGSTDSTWRESTLLYDGTTLTETAGTIISNDNGSFTTGAPTKSGSNLLLNFTTAGALSNMSGMVDLTGTYYVP